MTSKERDELRKLTAYCEGMLDKFGRLDERSLNMWHVLERLEKHQAEQNGYIRENFAATNKNTAWRKIHSWVMGVIFFSLVGLLINSLI